MHTTQQMHLRAHHETHDDLIDTATSHVTKTSTSRVPLRMFVRRVPRRAIAIASCARLPRRTIVMRLHASLVLALRRVPRLRFSSMRHVLEICSRCCLVNDA